LEKPEMTLIFLAMLLTPPPGEDELQALRVRIESGPLKVAKFIERRAGCNHFTGEEPYDPDRAAELDKAIRELRCARIDRDERALTRKYRDKPAILRLLKDTEDLSGW
jgi:hypothetical protein